LQKISKKILYFLLPEAEFFVEVAERKCKPVSSFRVLKASLEHIIFELFCQIRERQSYGKV